MEAAEEAIEKGSAACDPVGRRRQGSARERHPGVALIPLIRCLDLLRPVNWCALYATLPPSRLDVKTLGEMSVL